MSDKACIYVAGPLSAPTLVEGLNNIGRMLRAARDIKKLGHAPFFPAWDILLAFANPGVFDYEDFFESNAAWLKKADAVYVISQSPGVCREIDIAREAGIPVLWIENEVEWLERGKDGKWRVKIPILPESPSG